MKFSRGFSVLAVICCLGPLASAATPAKPNIVFILADDLGYRDVGCLGSNAYKTPNIDALAKRGMIFTQAYAASPLCSSSRASIITGQYPARIGITEAVCHLPEVRLREAVQARASADQKSLSNNSVTRLSANYVTLAETLKAAGYITGHFGKWHLGAEPYSPLQQGFDVDVPHWPGPGPAESYLAPWQFPPKANFTGKSGEHIEDRMAKEAVKFIEANKDRPFFLNYWSFSVHAPYEAKHSYVEEAALTMDEGFPRHNPVYAAMIHSLDDAVGTLVKTLEANNLIDNTIIVFFSDNGGVNWQAMKNESARRGGNSMTEPYVKIPPTSNDPLRGGKASIYEGGTRVPCFFVWPGVVSAGARTEAMIIGPDFYPTLTEAVGAVLPVDQIMDGRSFLPVLKGQSATARDKIFNFFPHYVKATGQRPAASVRESDWKLICYFNDGPEQEDRYELYDLHEDLGEANNLADAQPDRVKAMSAVLARFLDDTKATVPGPNPEYNPKVAASESGSINNSNAKAGVSAAKPQADPLMRWKLRGCNGTVKDGILTLEPITKKYLMAFAPPKLSGPLVIKFRVRSAKDGSGKVEWLVSADQPEPSSVPYDLTGGDWRDISITPPGHSPRGR
ncbi:DUF4976 domain-containing protein [bacterium]|nr:DUF4976 domain-containing protein [bacterium]